MASLCHQHTPIRTSIEEWSTSCCCDLVGIERATVEWSDTGGPRALHAPASLFYPGAHLLIDQYPYDDVFARVPELANHTNPVLHHLDHLLDDDML